MKTPHLLILSLAFTLHAQAGSATWKLNAPRGDWNKPANWTPRIVPNGPSDTATFDVSNTTAISLTAAAIEVSGIVYNPGASAFTTTVEGALTMLTISGLGLTNNSGVTQNFFVETEITFANSASAGVQVNFTTDDGDYLSDSEGKVLFSGNSTAGSAVFVNNGGSGNFGGGGVLGFSDSSNAGNAVITNNGRQTDTAITGGGTFFSDTANAASATITNMPNGEPIDTAGGGDTEFFGPATAGTSLIINEGATISGQIGGSTNFEDDASAEAATIICNGGQVAGAGGGVVHFQNGKPGTAILIANGGINGGEGGQIQLFSGPPNDAPRVELFGNGTLDVRSATRRIGSLEGDGIVDLGATVLEVGNNNLSTTFTGTIQGSGNFTKIGSGTLTLSGAHTITGFFIVEAGTLILTKSATVPNSLDVNGGTLGGGGAVGSVLTLGNGTPQGRAFLAPAAGSNKPTTFTIGGTFSGQSGGTYICTFKERGGKVRADKVVANGVDFDFSGSAPAISLQGTIQGDIAVGTTFTIIRNTSANPISGTFSNLADGAIATISGHNFQASYSGGDGNDLTLTVVP